MRPASVTLIYPRDLPSANSSGVHWRVRFTQKQRTIRFFGELLPQQHCQTPAHVTITRVQGKGQRALDDDNLRIKTKGLRDALKHCGYIVDDRLSCATFTYQEDATRRHLGPRIEVSITYEGGSHKQLQSCGRARAGAGATGRQRVRPSALS